MIFAEPFDPVKRSTLPQRIELDRRAWTPTWRRHVVKWRVGRIRSKRSIGDSNYGEPQPDRCMYGLCGSSVARRANRGSRTGRGIVMPTSPHKPRLLIFIVAYNAERTIQSVLQRIPRSLSERYDTEVLIIEDSSQDETFARAHAVEGDGQLAFPLTVLCNPVNQGYGGN